MVVTMHSGLDRISAGFYHGLENKRIALICNQTSVDWHGNHAAEVLSQIPGTEVALLLGPEHDTVQLDPVFGIPVKSLYGANYGSLIPDPAVFSDVDAVVYDVQDIGTRYYTYAATLALTMEVTSKTGQPVWVLDRPNPIGHTV
jgi:uncharacterized protein YbbC (DUF1343 family)